MQIIQEFKTFALRGNVIDLAIGVVIGASFNDITNSLVNDILNPILGLLTGPVDLADKVLVLRRGIGEAPAVTLNYGHFLSTLLSFLIVALVIFLFIRQVNKLAGTNLGSIKK